MSPSRRREKANFKGEKLRCATLFPRVRALVIMRFNENTQTSAHLTPPSAGPYCTAHKSQRGFHHPAFAVKLLFRLFSRIFGFYLTLYHSLKDLSRVFVKFFAPEQLFQGDIINPVLAEPRKDILFPAAFLKLPMIYIFYHKNHS